jgi:hypothetical protein
MDRAASTATVLNPFRQQAGADPEAAPASGQPAPIAAGLPLRAMTGYEEEYVEANAAEGNTARLVNELLARCLVAPGADCEPARATVGRLLVAERDAALIALRRLSLGDSIESEADCPACGSGNRISFDLGALPVDTGAPVREVVVDLPESGPAVLRLPTAADQEALLDAGLEGAAARLTWLIAKLTVRLGDVTGPFDAAAARAMPVGARRAIEDALATATPDLDLSMAVTCQSCGEPFVVPFDVASFFLRR